MPIPDKHAGDEVRFDHFPFFAPSRVLAARSSGLGGLLIGEESVELGVRQR
jgi:hypothetical protein